MKPLLLKLKGINSFQEEQTIDFTKLTGYGLFGIFGPTGSGKSTILDGITIALYDKIARGIRKFINKEETAAYVLFSFELKKGGEAMQYTIERSYQRTNTAECKAITARLIEQKEQRVLAEGSTNVTKAVLDIVGISYEDFTRSVVLPQGKFSEFLSLGGKDRRNMLERIFHFEKFGSRLLEKIREEAAKEENHMATLAGSLKVYGDLSKETIEKAEQELAELSTSIENAIQDTVASETVFIQKKAVFDAITEQVKYQTELKRLRPEEKIQNETRLSTARRAEGILPLITSYEATREILRQEEQKRERQEEAFQKATAQEEELNKAYQIKKENIDKYYGPLLKKAEALQTAVKLQQEAEKAEQERKTLIQKYKMLKGQMQADKEMAEQLQQKKQSGNQELEGVLEQISRISIPMEKREAVRSGAEYQQKVQDCLSKREEVLKQAALNEQKRMEAKQVYAEQEQYFSEVSDVISSLEAQILKQKEEQTEREGALEKQKEQLIRIEGEQKEVYHLLDVEREWIDKKQTLCQSLEQAERQAAEWEEKAEQAKQALRDLSEQLQTMERSNMSGILAQALKEGEACPVCGSCSHPAPAALVMEAILEELKKQKEQAEKTCAEAESGYLQHQGSLEGLYKEKAFYEQELEKTIILLKGRTREQIDTQAILEQNRTQEWEIKLRQLQNAIKEAEKELKKKEAQRNTCQQEVTRQKVIIKTSMERKRELEEDFSKLEEVLSEWKGTLQSLQRQYPAITDWIAENDQYTQWEKKKAVFEQKEKTLRQTLFEIEQNQEQQANKIAGQEMQLSVIETQGKERRSVIEEKLEKIKQTAGDKHPAIYLSETEQEISRIQQEEKVAEKAYLAAQESQKAAERELLRIVETLTARQKQQEEQEAKWKQAMKEKGFTTIDEVKKGYLPSNEQKLLEEWIEDFTKKQQHCQNNIERLQAIIGEQTVTAEEVQLSQQKRESKKQEQEQLQQSFAVKQSVYKQACENLKKMEELQKEMKKTSHQCSLYDELLNVTRGNKFVEYLSLNQLLYITKEASKRLKQITCGRYGLELNKTEFIIRDDFNGGVRREPATLSGGEIFLTSFALALALSSKIQMKNNAPLRFFFLDEGFGTLDSGLLETVITALENLREEDFTVGVITHVEEMKNRMPVKVMVSPAVQGMHGSQITVI